MLIDPLAGVLLTGREPKLVRIMTGLYTLDHAFKDANGKIGIPIKGIMEISGRKGIGKSTAAYSLAGIVARQLKSNIVLIDTEEHVAVDYLKTILAGQGYAGEIHNVDGKHDADLLQNGLKRMEDEKQCVGILDSVGGISPISEDEGNLGDANMGQRAKLMSNFARRVIKIFRYKQNPSIMFATNHLHANMGSRGEETSGGVTFRHLTSSRVRLFQKEIFDDGSVFLQGKVTNNTFGVSNRSFYLFLLSGKGIHPGLSAVYDCLLTGIAKLNRTVKLGDKSYGYIKNLIEQADDAELFQPFIDSLKDGKAEYTVSTDEGDE